MIYFVGAYANNHVMGKDGHLPWPRMANDIANFHKLTKDKTVAMGEKTYQVYQSVKHAFGVGKIYVLTRSHSQLPDAQIISLDELIEKAKNDQIWVIGGGSIFKQLLDKVDKMYITEIN